MKNVLLTLSLILSLSLNSQSLTDLLYLQRGIVDDASAYLQKTSWKFHGITGSSEDKLGRITYNNFTIIEGKSTLNSTLTIFFKDKKVHRLNIRLTNPGIYMDYMIEVENFNGKKIFEGYHAEERINVYQNNTTTFISKFSNEVDIYGFHKAYNLSLWPNQEYTAINPFQSK